MSNSIFDQIDRDRSKRSRGQEKEDWEKVQAALGTQFLTMEQLQRETGLSRERLGTLFEFHYPMHQPRFATAENEPLYTLQSAPFFGLTGFRKRLELLANLLARNLFPPGYSPF